MKMAGSAVLAEPATPAIPESYSMRSRVIRLMISILWTIQPAFLMAAAADSALSGTVLDNIAEPVHASVTAFQLKIESGFPTPTQQCVAETDSDGRFACRTLTPGTYVLVIRAHSAALGSVTRAVQKDTPVLYSKFTLYPNLYDGNSVEVLHLGADRTLSVDIRVNDKPINALSVHVPQGAKGRRLQVFWQADDLLIPVFNDSQEPGQPDETNNVAGLPSGTYLLVKSWIDHGKKHEASGSITVNELSENTVSLDEINSYDISGSVTIAPDAAVRARGAGSIQASKIVLSSAGQVPPHRYVASLDGKGEFVLKDVAAGKYSVSLDGENGLYVSDIFVGDRREEGATIEVGENMANLPLVLTEKATSGSVSGSLELDGTELKPGILLHSLNSHVNMIVPAKGDGSFSVTGLAPGEYLLYGWDDVDSVPYESLRFLERYKSKALSLSLDADSRLTGLDVECNEAIF
jgi:hypothetical protein